MSRLLFDIFLFVLILIQISNINTNASNVLNLKITKFFKSLMAINKYTIKKFRIQIGIFYIFYNKKKEEFEIRMIN